MRAGLYARVSRKEQAEEGYSIEAQREAMRRFCHDRDWEIACEFIEPGVSGTIDDRPSLQEALRAAETGRLDVLVTHRLDRFFRNLGAQIETLKKLASWGVAYVSTTEQLDYSTPQGAMFMQMLGSFNEYYSANLGREVKKGKLGRAKAGLSNASIPAYGFKRVNGREVLDEREAPGVVMAYEAYATGDYSDQEIADLLTREGYPAPGVWVDHWLSRTARVVLTNRFYVGEVVYRGTWYQGEHTPLIEEELWEQCRAIRLQKGKDKVGGKKSSRVYLLHRTATCWHCKRRLHVGTQHGVANYRDPARMLGIDCPVSGRQVRAVVADPQVARLVERLRLPDDWRERLEELANHREERQNVEGKRKYLQGRLSRLRDLYVDGDYSRAEYDGEKTELQAQLDALRLPESPDVERAGETLESLGKEWANAPKRYQRDMLRVIFRAIYIDIAAQKVVCVKPYPQFVPLFRMDGLEEREDGCFYWEGENEEAGSED